MTSYIIRSKKQRGLLTVTMSKKKFLRDYTLKARIGMRIMGFIGFVDLEIT